MKIKIILYLFFLYSTASYACLSTTQFKTFPIGIYNGNIITIDAFIYRDSYTDKDGKEKFPMPKILWEIKTFIAIYDMSGKLISKQEIEMSEIKNDKYLSQLQSSYKKGIQIIKKRYSKLEYFKPSYISYCDFQKKCEILEIENDTINKKDYLIYKEEKHSINLNNYNEYKKSMLYSDNLTSYFISSTRIYRTDKIEIVIAHLETGHEISMGWITTDQNKKPKDDYDVVIIAKEKKPEFEFVDLENAVYEEPLLHHGYGFDFLIVTKNK